MDPHDPFLCDAADLRALASDVIVERGIDYQRQGRVKHFERAGDQLVAEVQGSDEAPYTLTLRAAVDGGLSLECSCPFDWEPVCKHGIAALLAYTDGATEVRDEGRPDGFLGREGLGELFAECMRSGRDAKDSVLHLAERTLAMNGGGNDDDVTLLVARRL